VYPDPDTFRPERHLGHTPEQDPRLYSFGFGRRVCPGQALAEASVFAACATALATVNISKAVDEEGRVLEPSGDYFERSIRLVGTYITPRVR
jgi:cytochrome P450